MRRTPPVVVQVRPQPGLQALVAAIAGTTAAALVAWATSHLAWAWPALLLVPLAAAWGWRASAPAPRRLRWDGEAWWLAGPGSADETRVRVDVLIDLDHWLLLHTRTGPAWLPLARREQGAVWGALRATLHAAPAGPQDA